MLESAPFPGRAVWAQVQGSSTPTSDQVPTVTIYSGTPLAVPTVNIPRPTPTPTPKRVHHRKKHRRVKAAKHVAAPVKKRVPAERWFVAYLTSYCPGSAGWLSASGIPVHYGMLANDFYSFGTEIYIPVLGMTGVVQDRENDYAWNHFDVWSPSCYGTPTGYFKVAVVTP